MSFLDPIACSDEALGVVDLSAASLAALESITVTIDPASLAALETITVIEASNKVEDAAHVSGDTGVFILAVRNDTGAAFTTTDGDYSPIAVDAMGAIRLQSSYLEDAAHVSGDRGLFILAVRNSAGAALTTTDGDYSPVAVDDKGRLILAVQVNEDSAASDGAGGYPFLGVRNDAGAVKTSADGDYGHIAIDSAGRLLVQLRSSYAEDAAHVSGDQGVFTLGVRNDNVATALTDTNGDYSPIATTNRGAVYVVPQPAVGGAALANVNDSAASATLQASNTSRKGLIVYNDSISDLFLKYGATASLTSFTYKIPAGGTFEMPQPIYTGVVDGIWSADTATGAARVTELT